MKVFGQGERGEERKKRVWIFDHKGRRAKKKKKMGVSAKVEEEKRRRGYMRIFSYEKRERYGGKSGEKMKNPHHILNIIH